MDIGFIGLGNMGQPMARRLIEAGHKLIIYDTRNDAAAPLVALGAQLASSPADVADRVETVMASLPSLQISEKVATGEGGVIHGKRIKRFIDLSTTGRLARCGKDRGGIGEKEHRADRLSGERRGWRRQERHAGSDGFRAEGRNRSSEGCARSFRHSQTTSSRLRRWRRPRKRWQWA